MLRPPPYVLELTQLQQSFFHALLAPFHDHELSKVPGRGTSELTYIDKRALENRLDTVCGLGGWYPTYRAIEPGTIVCELSILVPGTTATLPPSTKNGWYWLTKEDGGGYEGMVRKSGGEIIADSDNDAKSAITNALRRAAQDAWGIGRFLYRKGVVGWLSLENPPLERTPARLPMVAVQESPIVHDVNEYGITVDFTPESRVKTAVARALAKEQEEAKASKLPADTKEITGRARDVQPEPDPVVAGGTIKSDGLARGETLYPKAEQSLSGSSGSSAGAPPVGAGAGPTPSPKPTVTPINLPRDSRSVFNWAKRMEGIFEQRLVQGMTREAIDKGYPRGMAEWNQDQLSDICLGVVCHLLQSPKYNGEFDHLSGQVVEHLHKPTTKPPAVQPAGVNLADIRKRIATSLEALIKYQTGHDATQDQCREMVLEIAPQCKNSSGVAGEVPERLSAIVDSVWLANIQAFLDDQISHAKSNMATEIGPTKTPF